MERLGPDAFSRDRLNKKGRWGVCFAADWCPFCVEFLPQFTATDPPKGVHLAHADLTDLENPLWEIFEIEVVPTLAVFVDGRLTWRRDGRLGRGLGAADLKALDEALRPMN